MTAMGPAQRAAWDAYLAVTALLPAFDNEDEVEVNTRLGGVVVRLRRYAPLWGEQGQMLVAAGHSAVRLYRNGQEPELAALLQVIAYRLFLLSARRCNAQHPGYRKQRAPWNRRLEP